MPNRFSKTLALAAIAGFALGLNLIAFSEGGESVEAQLARARTAWQSHDFKEAGKIYQDILKVDPANQRARLGWCWNLNAREEREKAMTCVNQLITDHPDFQHAYYLRGLLHENLGERDAAKASYQKYAQLGPVPADPTVRIKLRQFGVQ